MWSNRILVLQCSAILVMQLMTSVISQEFISPDELFASLRNNEESDSSTAIPNNPGDADGRIIANSEVFEEKTAARAKTKTADGRETELEAGPVTERKSSRNFYRQEVGFQDLPYAGNRGYTNQRYPFNNPDSPFNQRGVFNNNNNFSPPMIPSWVREELDRSLANRPRAPIGNADISVQGFSQDLGVPFGNGFNGNINQFTRPGWVPLTVNRNPMDHFPTGFRTQGNLFDSNFGNEGPMNGMSGIRTHNSGFRTTSFTNGNGETIERTVSW